LGFPLTDAVVAYFESFGYAGTNVVVDYVGALDKGIHNGLSFSGSSGQQRWSVSRPGLN
jgi:hypothetical protein